VNRYGEMARSHWQRWLPQQYAAIADPDSFFSAIGQEADQQISELADQIAGETLPGEGYLERAGRLAAARSQAEEIILPQQVLPPPDPAAEDEDLPEDSRPLASQDRPAVISPGHPLWAEVNAEQRERLGRDG